MSRGALRVLVKCLRICVLCSVKQKEIVVQEDTADLFSTFSLKWVQDELQGRLEVCYASCLNLQNVTQLGGHHLMRLCLKITRILVFSLLQPISDLNSFHLHSLSFCTFSPSVFQFVCPPLCLLLHAFILLSAFFEEHMLYLSIKTQYGFS